MNKTEKIDEMVTRCAALVTQGDDDALFALAADCSRMVDTYKLLQEYARNKACRVLADRSGSDHQVRYCEKRAEKCLAQLRKLDD